jgi:hypothetical protein
MRMNKKTILLDLKGAGENRKVIDNQRRKIMDNLEVHLKLKTLFAEYGEENEKFVASGNKAAGTRARKALMEISKLCKTRRGEIQESKNNA